VHRKRKARFCLIVLFLLVAVVVFYVNDCPLVLKLPSHANLERQKFERGDTIKPLERFNFDQGEWTAFVSISSTDKIRFSNALPESRWLRTNDIKVLKQMQREWVFRFSGGDLATVESFILILNNGVVVFHSGVVLEENCQGLQSRDFGWLDSSVLIQSISRFEKMLCPLVVL